MNLAIRGIEDDIGKEHADPFRHVQHPDLRARIKVMVKRILNKHGYPPDLQEDAVKTVLMQAELLCAEWV